MRDAILASLTYHDLFDRPLTLHEVRLAATPGTRPEDLVQALEALEREGRVSVRHGLWCLAGRESTIGTRKHRYALAEGKYGKVRRFVRLARHLPFLQGVAVCNTLARSNARESSDIDLFVVAEPGRVWSCRLFVTGLAALLGVRPTAQESRDRICLSFFAAADALDLRPLAIVNDVYLRHWTREIAPVYEERDAFSGFAAANAWRERLHGDGVATRLSGRRRLAQAGAIKRAVEGLVGRFGARFEASAKRLQLRLMPEHLKTASEHSVGVVLTDAILKFHDDDRREDIRARYETALRAMRTAREDAHVIRALA